MSLNGQYISDRVFINSPVYKALKVLEIISINKCIEIKLQTTTIDRHRHVSQSDKSVILMYKDSRLYHQCEIFYKSQHA